MTPEYCSTPHSQLTASSMVMYKHALKHWTIIQRACNFYLWLGRLFSADFVITLIRCSKIHKCHNLNNGFYMLAKTDRSQRSLSRPYAEALVTRELFTRHQLFWKNALTLRLWTCLCLNSNYWPGSKGFWIYRHLTCIQNCIMHQGGQHTKK